MSDNDTEAATPAAQLADLVDGAVTDLEDVDRSSADGSTAYARGGVAFARFVGPALEVRLPDDILAAALRTPDTAAVGDDPGWLRFTPATDEPHVHDRARAWLVTAWRHAGAPG